MPDTHQMTSDRTEAVRAKAIPADAIEAASADDNGCKETKQRRTSNTKKQRQSSEALDAKDAAAEQEQDLTSRLLMPVQLPAIELDRRLVASPLLEILDEAELGSPQLLPSSLFMALAAVAAVVGPNVRCVSADGPDPQLGKASGLSLRVCVISSDGRRSLAVPPSLLAGLYAAENAAFDGYREKVALLHDQARAAAERRRRHNRLVEAASMLGVSPLLRLRTIPVRESQARARGSSREARVVKSAKPPPAVQACWRSNHVECHPWPPSALGMTRRPRLCLPLPHPTRQSRSKTPSAVTPSCTAQPSPLSGC